MLDEKGWCMFIINYLGRFFIALALLVLGIGIWLWLSGEDITLPGGQLWFTLDNASLNYLQVIIQRHLSLPAFWDGFIVPYMLQPPAWKGLIGSFIGLMLISGILLLVSKKREGRRIFRN